MKQVSNLTRYIGKRIIFKCRDQIINGELILASSKAFVVSDDKKGVLIFSKNDYDLLFHPISNYTIFDNDEEEIQYKLSL